MQPLDYDPNPNGNVILRADFRETKFGISQVCEPVGFLEQLTLGEPPAERYMPHHATCPNASELRNDRTG